MSNQNPTRVVTGEVRLSYVHVWEPNSIQGSKPKYSVSLIIPKTDTATITAIERAIDAATPVRPSSEASAQTRQP